MRAHESLTVAQADLVVPELSFDSVQHLVSVATGEAAAGDSAAPTRRGLRTRLAHVLDSISGSAPRT